ncbi:MAG: hypothetical protein UT54_C0003G0009 [Candidatus Daviesbacteria bacterium GW2011_GWB1_39_5]|uniref:Uncharacterized protein n=1 Tax=Candidatus Daviesbacteria bacterium GW2011_GWC2_40_12 TaxID=1618431 RepID=A0A0G0QRR4_9BACT|nr:MAG: hypothetical protein UT04_C0061G0002 [Candidatus Daviesbacteria bacterium GW2011_GWF2_38_7]KKR17471.1 MAG: hypothetical protein UT45_C0001G0146 [Candidatus Daviesbacteria bacterium GW2011_GWA2_39_33]KKR25391.1 MAG: hypothetical protein UT54_C0003G0009 [Candidatus Daviesbacteria bacterium GW2011_GWB1_39_5]KKR42848.1 MAG: hypothetical protein UT77_C0001G0299 [Candidatus Daviesbacteria bacterium GW2011_GWC2_40_12]OGE29067.1 MAG: hypothetical protein A3C29_06830 [Candidatus Daviesbacteria b
MKEKLDKLMPLVYSYCQHTNMDSDYIREKILEALYRIHNKARGKKSLLVGIRDLTQEVKKDLPKIKENEVFSNTRFLIENEFVKEEAIENYFANNKFGNSKPSYKYCLTKEGLAYFEHGSKFDKSNVFAGIGDITGDGNNIIIGNQNTIANIANAQFVEGHKLAEDLRRRVNALGELPDEQKISIQSDLETIKSQLAKQQPDTGILQKAKDNIAFLADITAVATPTIALLTWLSTQFHF